MSAAPDLTIAICTADRPALCADLLASLAAAAAGRWSRAVVVVDNGRDRPVDDALLALHARPDLPIARLTAPTRNIARARNAALRAAASPLVLWLDDDQLVAPGFFHDLERAWAHRPAGSDGLRLAVRPAFDDAVSPTTRAFFTPPLGPEGAVIDARTFATNGLLVRRDALLRAPPPASPGASGEHPFDPWFGTRGGEDTELFRRASPGLRVTSTHLAAVVERVPRARARPPYMRRRAFRVGFTDTVLELRSAPPPAVLTRAALALARGVARLPSALGDADSRLAWQLDLARQLGKAWALLGRDLEHYRAPEGGQP